LRERRARGKGKGRRGGKEGKEIKGMREGKGVILCSCDFSYFPAMTMVDVDGSCQSSADSQSKSTGLV